MKKLSLIFIALFTSFLLMGTASAADTVREAHSLEDQQWEERVLRFTGKHKMEES